MIIGNLYKKSEKGYIKINSSSKTMTIKRGWGNAVYTYYLDGWTGRYGMPLEFLLSVHLTTMAPDLAVAMATSFETDVQIYLHKVDDGEIHAYLQIPSNTSKTGLIFEKTEDGIFQEISVTTENVLDDEGKIRTDLYERFSSSSSNGTFNEEEYEGYYYIKVDTELSENNMSFMIAIDENGDYVINMAYNRSNEMLNYKTLKDFKGTNFFDSWGANNAEAKDFIKAYGLYEDYYLWYNFWTTSKDEGGAGKDDKEVKAYLKDLVNAFKHIEENNNDAYTPYIEQVLDHWYRNVYFKIYDKDSILTQVDEDYEILTGERWTDYLKDKEGNYILDTSGSKIANTITAGQLEGWNDTSGWSAYETGGSTTTVTALDIEESNTELIAFDRDLIYVQETRISDIKQVEEAVRGETNPTIKKLFLEDEWYIYDGTVEKANAIAEDSAEYIYEEEDFVYYDEYGIEYPMTRTVKTENEKYQADASLKSKVDITANSLSAFSMLENTHTLDADYIYRDFKELIVELNYFDKEELSEKAKEVFEWPLPDASSVDWPYREYDKPIDEYGTLIHSKVNLDYLVEQDAEETTDESENQEADVDNDVENTSTSSDSTSDTSEFTGFEADQQVVSPVTGKILGTGKVTVENENGISEETDYIKILVLDTDKIEGYESFYEEYKDVCDGFIFYMEGFTYELANEPEDKYTENVTPILINKTKQTEEEEKEKARVEAPTRIDIDGDTYIKEGAVIGKTTDSNIKIIMKDLDNAVVENVENYIEKEEESEGIGSLDDIWGFCQASISEEFGISDTALIQYILTNYSNSAKIKAFGLNAEKMQQVCRLLKSKRSIPSTFLLLYYSRRWRIRRLY